VSDGDWRGVEKFVSRGADIDRTYITGPPIATAAFSGDVRVCRTLVGLGAKLEDLSLAGGRNLMHMAAIGGDIEVINLFRTYGVALNSVDDKEQNPLHYAAKYRRIGACVYFASLGIDPNSRDEAGNTPLHIAISELQNLRQLVELYNMGHTNPAYFVDADDYVEELFIVVDTLVRFGASLDLKNNAGETAISISTRCNEPGFTRRLQELAGE